MRSHCVGNVGVGDERHSCAHIGSWPRWPLATIVLAACGSGDSNAGNGKAIEIWEGYTGAEAKAFARMVALYDKTHPGVTVQPLFVNNDNTLTKVQAAVRGGTPPDIAYLYGSWAPNVAKIT